jgi:hypothetical protein
MLVAALRKHFVGVADLMREAGASSTALNGVTVAANALAPFDGYKLDQFAAFLRVADDYHRAGLTPANLPKPASGGTGKTAGGR